MDDSYEQTKIKYSLTDFNVNCNVNVMSNILTLIILTSSYRISLPAVYTFIPAVDKSVK